MSAFSSDSCVLGIPYALPVNWLRVLQAPNAQDLVGTVPAGKMALLEDVEEAVPQRGQGRS